MPEAPTINQETLFNAGIDTALQISKLAKQAEYFASNGDYPMWYIKLEAWERWMSPKIRPTKTKKSEDIKKKGKVSASEEIENLKNKYIEDYKKYLRRVDHDKKVPKKLNERIKEFLTEYENSLMFWRDKFGYGMPLKDDARFALG